jgi:glycosyltransferase involved in cell wall biosynthesis
MPVYNAEKFLRESIESILNQSETNFELIIVNDGSNDRSEEIIKSYDDERIVYLEKENGGEASARNIGLNHAKGEFIAWQDADDISLPNRLATLKSQFASSNIGFVHSDMLLIDEAGKPIGYWQSQQIDKKNVLKFMLEVGTPYNNPSIMVRKSVIGKYRFDESLKVGTDTDMVLNFASECESIHVNQPLMQYRRHNNNLSNESNYNNLYLHMSKFIKKSSLTSLLPEINWDRGSLQENEAKAYILLALLFSRRGMYIHANDYIWKTKDIVVGIECNNFIIGISNIVLKKYDDAIKYLNLIEHKDYLVENYIGESYAFLGKFQDAKEHFLMSLSLNPNYDEPLKNLKAIGSRKGLNFIDSTWRKYISTVTVN